MRAWRRAAFALLALAVATTTANAQGYPNKPIRLIVSIAAGSVTDVIMRAAAAELQGRLGQPLIIENIGGAAGILGGKTCAQAAGGGYGLGVSDRAAVAFDPGLFAGVRGDRGGDVGAVGRLG